VILVYYQGSFLSTKTPSVQEWLQNDEYNCRGGPPWPPDWQGVTL